MDAPAQHKQYNQIFDSDLPEVDRLLKAFVFVVEQVNVESERAIQLAKALGDDEQAVRIKIKRDTLKFAQQSLETSYARITGKKFQANR
jgi:hypothetical protein